MKYTILVNKDNKFNDKYLSKYELVETTNINNNKILVEKETYNNYLELKDYLSTINIEIGIDSAYRSNEEQQEIYNYYLDKFGQEYCDNYVAPTGYSEHLTSLAIDFYIKKDDSFPYDDTEVDDWKEYEEIHKILHKYGFILRYPKGKEKITGYNYEPWHIRYVGKVPAKIIYENNLTLEEYLKEFGGVIYINKPKEVTSFDVVNDISHLFGIKRVGHTGTLDPLAEGVLVVCIGKATKIVELLTSLDKEYISEAKLGIKTDTYDLEGTITDRKEINNTNIEDIIKSFKKTYLQEVPIYSAIKVNGKKLYEYARSNKKVTLPKKEVTIKEIELLDYRDDYFKIKTTVSKGCYIRSLINDIGISLNTYATMTSLIRTKQGNIKIEDTNTIEDIKNNNYTIHSIEESLNYKIIVVDKELEFKISNGMKIDNIWNIKNKVIFKNEDNKLLGIYEVDNKKLRTWKNFN